MEITPRSVQALHVEMFFCRIINKLNMNIEKCVNMLQEQFRQDAALSKLYSIKLSYQAQSISGSQKVASVYAGSVGSLPSFKGQDKTF